MRRLVRAVLLLASVGASATGLAQSPPPCASPAPLLGPASCDATGYIVGYKSGTDVVPLTHALEAKYGFTANKIWYSAVLGFYSSSLTPQQVALLRCEPQVDHVERDLPWCIPGLPCGPDPIPSGPCAAPVEIPTFGYVMKISLVFALAIVALFLQHRS